jgi:hypothetical protein
MPPGAAVSDHSHLHGSIFFWGTRSESEGEVRWEWSGALVESAKTLVL